MNDTTTENCFLEIYDIQWNTYFLGNRGICDIEVIIIKIWIKNSNNYSLFKNIHKHFLAMSAQFV